MEKPIHYSWNSHTVDDTEVEFLFYDALGLWLFDFLLLIVLFVNYFALNAHEVTFYQSFFARQREKKRDYSNSGSSKNSIMTDIKPHLSLFYISILCNTWFLSSPLPPRCFCFLYFAHLWQRRKNEYPDPLCAVLQLNQTVITWIIQSKTK